MTDLPAAESQPIEQQILALHQAGYSIREIQAQLAPQRVTKYKVETIVKLEAARKNHPKPASSLSLAWPPGFYAQMNASIQRTLRSELSDFNSNFRSFLRKVEEFLEADQGNVAYFAYRMEALGSETDRHQIRAEELGKVFDYAAQNLWLFPVLGSLWEYWRSKPQLEQKFSRLQLAPSPQLSHLQNLLRKAAKEDAIRLN